MKIPCYKNKYKKIVKKFQMQDIRDGPIEFKKKIKSKNHKTMIQIANQNLVKNKVSLIREMKRFYKKKNKNKLYFKSSRIKINKKYYKKQRSKIKFKYSKNIMIYHIRIMITNKNS